MTICRKNYFLVSIGNCDLMGIGDINFCASAGVKKLSL